MAVTFECPGCGVSCIAPFSGNCQYCEFDIAPVAGTGMTDWQVMNARKHNELARGEEISIPTGGTNASFLPSVANELYEYLRFAITYNHPATWQTQHGPPRNVLVTRYPVPIGEGTYIGASQREDCYLMAIMSPASQQYSHVLPAIEGWVADKLIWSSPRCQICGKESKIGEAICTHCMSLSDNDWRKWLISDFLKQF